MLVIKGQNAFELTCGNIFDHFISRASIIAGSQQAFDEPQDIILVKIEVGLL